jgi:chromosome segregation ATPase
MMKFSSNSGSSIKNLSSTFRDAAPTNASALAPTPSSSSWAGNNSTSSNSNNHADPGILEFGTSVTVHDEMRRAIGMEIQEIEASLTKYTNEIATEQKIRQELLKTQTAAHQEICHLRRGAIEAVERLEVNETVFMKLQDDDGSFIDTSSEWQTRMKEHAVQMELLKQDIHTYTEQFEQMRQQKQETIAAAETILDRIQQEQLDDKAAMAKEKNVQAKQELRYQQEKLRSLREQNQATQTRLEKWEQRLQIMVSSLHNGVRCEVGRCL